VGMKMEFPFRNVLKMTGSEGRERDVDKKLLDYSGRDHHENKRCTYWTEIAEYCKMKICLQEWHRKFQLEKGSTVEKMLFYKDSLISS
jgi:hypothetical protein